MQAEYTPLEYHENWSSTNTCWQDNYKRNLKQNSYSLTLMIAATYTTLLKNSSWISKLMNIFTQDYLQRKCDEYKVFHVHNRHAVRAHGSRSIWKLRALAGLFTAHSFHSWSKCDAEEKSLQSASVHTPVTLPVISLYNYWSFPNYKY